MRDGNLSGKYIVERADGQPRHASRYFVMNYSNDPYARSAMRAYADACASSHPALAADLRAVADYHDERAALAKRSSRPSTGNQASGGAAASTDHLVEMVLRRAETDPELAAQLQAALGEQA